MAEQQSSNVAAGATGDQQTSTARDDMPFPLEVRYMIIKDAVFPTHDCAAHGNIRHFDALTATRVLLAYPHLVYEVLELAKDFLGIASDKHWPSKLSTHARFPKWVNHKQRCHQECNLISINACNLVDILLMYKFGKQWACADQEGIAARLYAGLRLCEDYFSNDADWDELYTKIKREYKVDEIKTKMRFAKKTKALMAAAAAARRLHEACKF